MLELLIAAVVLVYEICFFYGNGHLQSLVHATAHILLLLVSNDTIFQLQLFIVHTALDMPRIKNTSDAIHHIIGLSMCICCIVLNDPYYFQLARYMMVNECSTIFLNLMKLHPGHFKKEFAISFFFCRIAWIPYVMTQVHNPYLLSLLLIHYAVNLFWFYKIVCIAYKTLTAHKTLTQST